MVSNLYLLALLISLFDIVFLTYKKDRLIDRYMWSGIILIPIIILGYWLKTTVHTTEAAMIAFCFIYLDSTLLLVIALFTILRSIRINVSGWIKVGVYGITILHLLTIWLSKDNNLYYASMTLIPTENGTATKMTSGPLKVTHYIYLGSILISIITALMFGFFRKGTYSKKTLRVYSIFAILGLAVYIYELLVDVDFSSLPFIYAAASFVITFRYDHFLSHNIDTLIGEKESEEGTKGFVAFDRKQRLLGYNKQFAVVFPEIKRIVIDSVIKGTHQELADYLYPLINRCIEQGNYSDLLHLGGRVYNVNVTSFSVNDSHVINGYLMEMVDITEEQERIELRKQYNERLGQDVKEKTEHIIDIQNSVVLGLANLVENRDDNTGGHIKRTSDVIKILVDEVRNQGLFEIDDEFAADIVRAAPMHDLGKIHIETAILCKPGRLTDNEYLVMKSHSTKSGEMVKIILEGVEESHFVDTAYNIARFHHERWDGNGYPEGRLGEDIPLEARVMAVADVYDALVSKRCYKEAMSFEKAREIMNENMGSQFDPAMRPVFNSCREKLEHYYSQQE